MLSLLIELIALPQHAAEDAHRRRCDVYVQRSPPWSDRERRKRCKRCKRRNRSNRSNRSNRCKRRKRRKRCKRCERRERRERRGTTIPLPRRRLHAVAAPARRRAWHAPGDCSSHATLEASEAHLAPHEPGCVVRELCRVGDECDGSGRHNRLGEHAPGKG